MYTGIKGDTEEVVKERALASARTSEAIRAGDVERVTYMGREVEIPRIDHVALGRPVDKQYDRNKASVESRLRAVGVSTSTVVNFLPILLLSDAVIEPLRKARIKAPKDNKPYSVFVFDDAFIEPTRMGVDSPLLAFDHQPIQLAQEFTRTNNRGVMAFIGIPSDLEDVKWLNAVSSEIIHGGRTYGQILEHTKMQAVEWMQERLRDGNSNERNKVQPSIPEKSAARRLYHLGYIKELPPWVERQRDLAVTIPTCPKCSRPSEPGSASCTQLGCGYIIDPRRAYEISAIAEDDVSLERLTREIVTEMGISDYVAETIDEKRGRLEQGRKKPLSMAAMRMLQVEDENAEYQRNRTAEVLADKLAKAQASTAKD